MQLEDFQNAFQIALAIVSVTKTPGSETYWPWGPERRGGQKAVWGWGGCRMVCDTFSLITDWSSLTVFLEFAKKYPRSVSLHVPLFRTSYCYWTQVTREKQEVIFRVKRNTDSNKSEHDGYLISCS